MDRHNNEKLESLRNSCKRADLENVNGLRDLLDKFDASIEAWPGLLPIDLRDFFTPEQIERLLSESIDYWAELRYYNLIERFVGFVARSGYRDEPRLDPLGNPITFRPTPVHRLARQTTRDWGLVAYWLFKIYNEFDVNYTDEDGLTHFHVACEHGLDDVVRKFLELGQDPNCLVPKTGDSPLHLAVAHGHAIVARSLLRHGAVPNSANGQGSIPLDVICSKDSEIEAAVFLQIFYDSSEAFRTTIDTPNERGDRQLEVALSRRRLILAQALLRSGADPNAHNTRGWTPLHGICQRDDAILCDSDKARYVAIRRLEYEIYHHGSVSINKLNQWASNKPWRLGLELLLSHGADPNLVSRDHRGGTALHIICQRYYDEGLVETLLQINDVVGRWPVQLDAVDVPHGRTPLQLAITNLLPEAVEALLERGADLTGFVFPAEHFAEMWVPELNVSRLRLASGLLACVELLAKKGYELAPRDAQTIAKLLLRCKFLDRSTNVRLLTQKAIIRQGILFIYKEDKAMIEITKNLMIKPDLSYHDLLNQPDLARTRGFTATDFYELTTRNELMSWLSSYDYMRRSDLIIAARLGQIMARGFCSRWRTTLARLEDDEFLNSCLEAASL